MRKAFAIVGATALAILVVLGVGFGVLIYQGRGLDGESRAYADDSIVSITKNWDKRELMTRASPELLDKMRGLDLDKTFKFFAELGFPQEFGEAKGQAAVLVSIGAGRTISATYAKEIRFEHGMARIDIGLIKRGDQWRITSFFVNSPALINKSVI